MNRRSMVVLALFAAAVPPLSASGAQATSQSLDVATVAQRANLSYEEVERRVSTRPGLDVVPTDLVDKDRHRRPASEPGVGTAAIVGVEPARQGIKTLLVGAI